MQSNTRDSLLDHEYDGIREYDNPTPAWWHAILLASILFSLFYFTYWEFSPVASSIQEDWRLHQVAEYRRIFGEIGDLSPDAATVLRLKDDPKMMAVAAGLFAGNCAACHARDGGGINGVNLTDDSYKNIRTIGDLFPTISKGANKGAMPAWENRLGKNERVILAAYVASLRGTRPAAPKGPEGEVIPAWPAPASLSTPAGGK